MKELTYPWKTAPANLTSKGEFVANNKGVVAGKIPSRRVFLGAFLGGGVSASGVGANIISKKASNTQLLNFIMAPVNAERPDNNKVESAYQKESARLGRDHSFWVDSGVLSSVNSGTSLYFGENLNECLGATLDICDKLGLRYDFALPVLAFWSKYKIGDIFRMQRENAAAVVQSYLSSAVDTFVPNLKTKVLEDLEKGKDVFNIARAMTDARTIGFLDKVVGEYAEALVSAIDVGAISEDELIDITNDNKFIAKLKSLLTTEKGRQDLLKPEAPVTEKDSEFAGKIQSLEATMVPLNHFFDFGMLSTLAFLKSEERLMHEAVADNAPIEWRWDNLSDQQYLLALWWMMIGTEVYGPLQGGNPMLEDCYAPAKTIPLAVSQIGEYLPQFLTKGINSVPPKDIPEIIQSKIILELKMYNAQTQNQTGLIKHLAEYTGKR